MNDRVTVLRSLILALALSGSAAVAETTVGANVSLTAGYGSNPFLTSGSGSSAATATGIASFDPAIVFAGPTNSVLLNGNVQHTTYSSRFRDQTDYTARGAFTQQLTPFSTLGFNAGYSRRTGTALIASSTENPEDPAELPNPDPNAAANAGRRVETLNGGASYQTRLAANLTMNAQVHASKVAY
ncbi:MAG TPA: hypothetical protein VNT42_07345, partial [Sphingomonas sp.]|nr:hypothetical protein [Sphingomonas sp.]